MSTQNNGTERAWVGLVWVGAAILLVVGLLTGTKLAAVGTWQLTRAAGIVAYLLLYASVVLGLLQSMGWLKGRLAPVFSLGLHEHLSLSALYATLFHFVILRWDHYVGFDWADLLIPFKVSYSPGLIALGIISFYLMLVAVLSTYLRARIGGRLWRLLHQLTLLAFLGVLIHGVLMGTDTARPILSYLYLLTGLSVLMLTGLRVLKGVRMPHANSAGRR